MSWCLQLTSWISLLGDQAALWTAGYAADSLVHKQQEVWEPRYSGCSRGHYGKCLYSMSISQMDSFLSAIFSTHIEFSGICDKNLVFCLLWSPNLLLLFLCFSPQDGVVDPMDSTLRDFSGRCIEEFVKWSIKQTTPKQQEKSPTNMKSLFKRIYSLALHPNGFKRLGAALTFNSIYRQFRYDTFISVDP